MYLTDIEKNRIEKINTRLSRANKSVLLRAHRLSDSYKKYTNGNDLDFNNINIDDKILIELIKKRNVLRQKYNEIATKIWEEKEKEEEKNEEF